MLTINLIRKLDAYAPRIGMTHFFAATSVWSGWALDLSQGSGPLNIAHLHLGYRVIQQGGG